MKIKRGSSIWQLATCWGSNKMSSNFWILVGESILSLMIVAFTATITSIFLAHILAGLAGFLVTGIFMWTMPLVLLAVILSLITVVIGVLLVLGSVQRAFKALGDNKKWKRSFLVVAYRFWKDKCCPIVEEV